MRLVGALGLTLVLGLRADVAAQTTPSSLPPSVLTRTYVSGEPVAYKMVGINESPQRKFHYQANARGIVEKKGTGPFIEVFAWRDLQVNGRPFPLSPESENFRENLSLEQGYMLAIPNLGKVEPVLIGPITDLLTFYADVQLAMRQDGLKNAGDHVYVKHGTPNSWADGHHILLGEDSIDFDLRLSSVDQKTHVAELVVRHVPPANPQIKLPATWMAVPVGSAHNNWVQIQKTADGTYAAGIGEETFEADIRIDISTGKILSAHLENPVEVFERECKDDALTTCGAPTRYAIRRQIDLQAEAPSAKESSRDPL